MMQLTTLACLLLLLLASPAFAQDSTESSSAHFQFTAIQQYHPAFPAKYSGVNSLQSTRENALSVTSTLFLGQRLWNVADLYFDLEMQGGSGFSSSRGVAGFPNGEVYRVDSPSPLVYLGRAFLRRHFALGAEAEWFDADQHQLAGAVPKERITLTIGKFSLTDIFDDNGYSNDARTLFMNWSLWAGAAWDYAADTRGYTVGLCAQLIRSKYQINFAAVAVPSTANGADFDSRISRAYSLNLELVKPFTLLKNEGRLHAILYLNHADMGNYRDAISRANNAGGVPNIDETNASSAKYGFVVSLELPLGNAVGLFSRVSWNDGHTETWAFTEIDRSFCIGLNVGGALWNRNNDLAGFAMAVNALSQDHRDFLAAGGHGFLIGDGGLNYAPENVFELFYSLKLTTSIAVSVDDQLIINPAYNKDRGPVVNAFGLRLHVAVDN